MEIRTLLVEDEPLALQTLRTFAGEIEGLTIVGEATTGPEAVRRMDRDRPDVVLLDVELPEFSGLEVLDRSGHDAEIVFTTAYDRHAVAAFELGALDYLVKPFGRTRFREAMSRVRRRLETGETPEIGAGRRACETLGEGPLERVFARSGDRIVPVRMEDVVRLEARGDYAALHREGQTHLVDLTMKELERRLDPRRFVRVHRSHIVNLDHVVEAEPEDERRLRLHLDDGSRVVASRSGSRRLRELIV